MTTQEKIMLQVATMIPTGLMIYTVVSINSTWIDTAAAASGAAWMLLSTYFIWRHI